MSRFALILLLFPLLGCSSTPEGIQERKAQLTFLDTLRVVNYPEHSFGRFIVRGGAGTEHDQFTFGSFRFIIALSSGKVVYDSRQAVGEAGEPVKGPIATAIWHENLLHVLYVDGRVYRYTETGAYYNHLTLEAPPRQRIESLATLVYLKEKGRYYASLAVDGYTEGSTYSGLPFIGCFDANSGALLHSFGEYPESYDYTLLRDMRKNHFVVIEGEVVVSLVQKPVFYHFSLDGELLKTVNVPALEAVPGSINPRRWWVSPVTKGTENSAYQYIRFATYTKDGTALAWIDPAAGCYARLSPPRGIAFMAPEIRGDTLTFFGLDLSDTTEDAWLYRAKLHWVE